MAKKERIDLIVHRLIKDANYRKLMSIQINI